jgi:hypothetical protein
MYLQIKTNEYLKYISKICVDNPILIKVNQDLVAEIEEAIKTANTSEEQFESKKSLAATLKHIKDLKDQIDLDNV